MTRIGNLALAFVFSVFAVAAHGAKPIQVTASVDRNEMSVGDTFTYTIEVSSEESVNVSDPKIPSLEGFEIINTWTGIESRSSFTNGTFEVVQTKQFNYMLSVSKAGTFTLAAANVLVDGRNYATQTIRIKVLQGRAAPPQAGQQQQRQQFEDMDDIFNQLLRRRLGPGTKTQPTNPDEAFFIQVEVDKSKAYVGEQVTASWYLYTRGQIHDIDTLKYPSLSGFWKEEIELATRLNFQQEVVNGIVYQRALLASYALFPIKPGNVSIDPYKAKCTVTVPTSFGFSRPYQFTKASKVISIQVQDVPKDNRPPDYTGAVGTFSAAARVDQVNAPAHQPLVLKVKFEGRGNAKLIDLPAIAFPPTIELYDTKHDAKFFKDGTSYKEFELTLIPRSPGPLTLPPIQISAFDPQAGSFYPVTTGPVQLNIVAGQAPQAMAGVHPGPAASAAGPKAPELPAPSLDWEASGLTLPVPKGFAWSFVYALVFAVLAWRLVVEGDFMRRKRDLKKMVAKRVEKIRATIAKNSWREVGTQGTNLIYFVLGEISGLGGSGQELAKMLEQSPPSVRRELGEPIKQLLQKLELLSFAPENLVGAHREKAQLKALVQQLEKTMDMAVRMVDQSSEEPGEHSRQKETL